MKITATLFARVGKFSKRYSNLPDRYIERVSRQVYYESPRAPQFMRRTIERTQFRYTMDRPWTNHFHLENTPGKIVKPVLVEPIKNWSFFRGDRVEILYGKDKGKQGSVRDIIEERNWIIVEGLNTKLVCMNKRKGFPGVYIQREQPLLVTTQVMLVDPYDMLPTPIEWRYTETGEHVRVSIRTGKIIPIPPSHDETIDFKHPNLYKDHEKDTPKKTVELVTFEPVLKTFEMDVMDKMGIKEDRIPKKTYWY